MAAPPAFAERTQRALIVSPFDDSVVLFSRLEASIRQEMQSELSSSVEIYTEFLDIGQVPDSEHTARVASFLQQIRRPSGGLESALVQPRSALDRTVCLLSCIL